MAKEFSVRVSEDLACWVRERGSARRVVGLLASAAHRGRLRADVSDPGPGPERLTVRVPERALPRIRTLTRSRDSLTALRKLILAGMQASALPIARALPALPSAVNQRALESRPVRHSPSIRVLAPMAYARPLTSESGPSLWLRPQKGSGALRDWLAGHPSAAVCVFLAFVVLFPFLLLFFAMPAAAHRVESDLPRRVDGSWEPESPSRLACLVWGF